MTAPLDAGPLDAGPLDAGPLDASPRRARAAGAVGLSLGVLSLVTLAACNDDGRDLRDPTFPLPPTTTTSTTLPPDTVAAVGP